MKKRCGNIEFLRFVFAICIVLHHAMIQQFAMRGGYLAVEFFFLLTGAFLGKYIQNHRNKINKINGWNEIFYEDVKYLAKRYRSIIPYFTVATFISFFIVKEIYAWTIDFERVLYVLSDFLFAQSFGLPVQSATGVVWYLSSMFIGVFLVFPIAMRYSKEYPKYVAPIVASFMVGALIYNYESLNVPAEYLFGVICTGNIRAFAMISLGLFVNFFSEKICVKLNEKKIIMLASLLELFLYGFFITYMRIWTREIGKFDFIAVIAIVVALDISLSGKSVWFRLLDNRFSCFLGRFSVPLFLSHFCWVQNIGQICTVSGLAENKTELEQKMMGLMMSAVTAFIVMALGNVLKKIRLMPRTD